VARQEFSSGCAAEDDNAEAAASQQLEIIAAAGRVDVVSVCGT
jgi:hypothetical protein